MDNIKYETEVISLGPMVQEFIDNGIMVFFGPDAPQELREFAIVHRHATLNSEIKTGDTVSIGGVTMTVLSVGHIANENLSKLGHFVVKFNGRTDPEMPGDISVAENLPVPDVKPGTVIKFVAGP